MASAAGFTIAYVEERPRDITAHYDKLYTELAGSDLDLDADVRESIAKSISRWQAALAKGYITWACFVARKPDRFGEAR